MESGVKRNVEVVTVEEPKITLKMIMQSGGSLFGLILMAIGVLLMITIIGILPGIGAVLLGGVIAIMSMPKTPVNCPACGLDTPAPFKAKNMTCENCETLTPLKWVKSE